MLAQLYPQQQPAYNAHAHSPYMPLRSSPLSSRSANACPRPQYFDMVNRGFDFGVTPAQATSDENATTTPQKFYPRREVKPNALLQRTRGDAGKERRRGMFLRKVAENRDNQRWDARTDQILRSDHLAQQRAWKEERQRSDNALPADLLAEAAQETDSSQDYTSQDLPIISQQPDYFNQYHQNAPRTPTLAPQYSMDDEVEALEQDEQQDLYELLSLNGQLGNTASYPASEHYGSEEEDYNDLFMDFINEEPPLASQQLESDTFMQATNDDMDMSGA